MAVPGDPGGTLIFTRMVSQGNSCEFGHYNFGYSLVRSLEFIHGQFTKRAMYWTLLNAHRFRYGSDEDNNRGWFNWLVHEIDTKLTLHMVQMPRLPLSDKETTRFWHALTELIAFHLAKGLNRGQSLSWAIDQLINDMYFNELLENTIPQFLDMFEGESVYDALTSLNHETVSFCERQGLAFNEYYP